MRRNDASLAAAELALLVEKVTLDTGAIDAVGTAGFWQIGPNALNSVPREAKLEIDCARHRCDAARRDSRRDCPGARLGTSKDLAEGGSQCGAGASGCLSSK